MTTHTAAAVAATSDRQAGPHASGVIHCTGNTFVTRVRLVDGRVDEAWSTGRMMRNVNVLLQGGLDANGHPEFVQQAHCLCNDGHALAAIRALENLAGVTVPRGAGLVRSIVQSLRCIQEHLLHVYQFHLSDWADPQAALRADPVSAARLSEILHIAPERYRDERACVEHLRTVQDRLRTLEADRAVDEPGFGCSGHPEYRGDATQHLLLHAHALEALRACAGINGALKLLACGPEGFRAYRVGGLPEDMELGGETCARLRTLLAECRDFIRDVFLPDLQRLARTYPRWAEIGTGSSLLACGDFSGVPKASPLFPGGVFAPYGDLAWAAQPLSPAAVREESDPAWGAADRDRYRLQPGIVDPSFTWSEGEFFWLPAPRHGGTACEAGPLARVVAGWTAGWTAGRAEVCQAMEDTLRRCGLSPAAMNSTLGRVLARGIESSVLAEAALEWLEALETLSPEDLGQADFMLPSSGQGTGWVEVPRGALSHTIRLENNRVAAHGYLIPSLWNFSPRDSLGGRGPLERALRGTPVIDPRRPLELLRTIHELDPCNGCKLVMEDSDTGRTIVVDAK